MCSPLHLPTCPGPVFGSRDYFTGLGIFFDTYSNHNGPHDVSALPSLPSPPPVACLWVGGLAVLTPSSPVAQHEHPFISAMVNNGSLHYDHDRDGTHSQISGCHCEFRAQPHNTYAIISYMDGVLAVSVPFPPRVCPGHPSPPPLLQVHTSVDGTNDWNECFVVDNINLPTGYYFGFTAATGELADNHDIISVRVFDVDREVGAEGEQVRGRGEGRGGEGQQVTVVLLLVCSFRTGPL